MLVGSRQLRGAVELDDLFRLGQPEELLKVISAYNSGSIPFPLLCHQDAFIQTPQDLVPLAFNPYPQPPSATGKFQLIEPLGDKCYQIILAAPCLLPRQKEYRYLYGASSYLFDVGYHAAAVAAYHETPEPITKAITALLETLLSLQVALVGRREGIALITKDLSKAALVDLALEGSSAGLPPPSVSTIATLFK